MERASKPVITCFNVNRNRRLAPRCKTKARGPISAAVNYDGKMEDDWNQLSCRPWQRLGLISKRLPNPAEAEGRMKQTEGKKYLLLKEVLGKVTALWLKILQCHCRHQMSFSLNIKNVGEIVLEVLAKQALYSSTSPLPIYFFLSCLGIVVTLSQLNFSSICFWTNPPNLAHSFFFRPGTFRELPNYFRKHDDLMADGSMYSRR